MLCAFYMINEPETLEDRLDQTAKLIERVGEGKMPPGMRTAASRLNKKLTIYNYQYTRLRQELDSMCKRFLKEWGNLREAPD